MRTSGASATASTSRCPTSQLADVPFYKPADDTPEMQYLHERRKALGGYLPQRRVKADERSPCPPLDDVQARARGHAEGREISTTHGLSCAS